MSLMLHYVIKCHTEDTINPTYHDRVNIFLDDDFDRATDDQPSNTRNNLDSLIHEIMSEEEDKP